MYYTSIKEMLQDEMQMREFKVDYPMNANDVEFTHDTKPYVVLPSNFGPMKFHLEDKAIRHLGDKLGPKSLGSYLMESDSDVVAWNLNRHREDKELLFRSYDDSMRGVMSKDFYTFDNYNLLKVVDSVLDDSGLSNVKLIHPFKDRDRLYVRVLAKEGINGGSEKGNYGFGALIANGECGTDSVKIMPLMQRTSCTNSTVWSKGAWVVRHVLTEAHSEGWWMVNAKEALGQAFRLSMDMINNITKAEMVNVPSLQTVIDEICKANNLTSTQKAFMYAGTEAKSEGGNVMNVINGLTFMSQRETDPQSRVRIETLAGHLLAQPDSLLGRAAKVNRLKMVQEPEYA